MRISRLVKGISIFLAAPLISGFILWASGWDSLVGVAVSSWVSFLGGMIFYSGLKKRRF